MTVYLKLEDTIKKIYSSGLYKWFTFPFAYLSLEKNSSIGLISDLT